MASMATFALKAELNFLRVLDIVHDLSPRFVSSFSRPPQVQPGCYLWGFRGELQMARIGILWHPRSMRWRRRLYLISQHAAIWTEEGHQVRHFRDARAAMRWSDLIIVHADASEVKSIVAPLVDHRLVLNLGVSDIRKSTMSDLVLHSGDPCTGPVVVKTNLNNRGLPERWLLLKSGFAHWDSVLRSRGYLLFPSLSDVPGDLRNHPAIVVERFEAQSENGHFMTASATFFGDEVSCVRLTASTWQVKQQEAFAWERLDEVPIEVTNKRRALGLDYGKIDFTTNETGTHIFDVNKTIGRIAFVPNAEQMRRMSKERLQARGKVIERYLSGEVKPLLFAE